MQNVAVSQGTIVEFVYTNYRGETAKRKVIPSGLRFGATEYHESPQWLLDAYDLEREADRTFAMNDIREWKPI